MKTCEAVFVGSNPARNTIKAPSVMKVAGNSPLKFLLFRKSADRAVAVAFKCEIEFA